MELVNYDSNLRSQISSCTNTRKVGRGRNMTQSVARKKKMNDKLHVIILTDMMIALNACLPHTIFMSIKKKIKSLILFHKN